MVLCATNLILIYIFQSPSLDMVADKLENKPEEFFVVTDADPILLQAISHLGEPIRFSSMDETRIDDLTDKHGTNDMEYQNSYYRVRIAVGDRVTLLGSILMWISLIGLVISTILLISLAIFKGLGHVRKRKEQQGQNCYLVFKRIRMLRKSNRFSNLPK